VGASATVAAPERIVSIDLLRGLDVLLMLFVNELAGVRGAPAFLLHTPSSADGLTITDVVFPAFLFITGMALPFALGARLRRGDTRASVWRHVLVRSAGLLVLGALMVNAEHASEGGLLSGEVWNVLMTIAVVLAWQAPARSGDPAGLARWCWVGVALLVVLAFLYRGGDVGGVIQLRPHWWGILGLIGWAYLVAASVYLLGGERPGLLAGATALLYCLYLADEAGHAAWLVALHPIVNVGRNLGSHAGVTLSGVLLGVLLVRHRRDGQPPRAFVAPALCYAAGLATAGWLLYALRDLDRAFWINKVLATAPWCLLTSAITTVVWVVVFALTDVGTFSAVPKVVAMAGENALVAYLLAPFLLSAFALSGSLFGAANFYEMLSQPVGLGMLRSALFAYLVVRLCGALRSLGVRMQL